MSHKITLKGRFLRTGFSMLLGSLLVAVLVTVLLLTLFIKQVPEGGTVLLESFSHLFTGQTIERNRLLPYLLAEGVLLCVTVWLVCMAVVSKQANQVTATLKRLCQATEHLRSGDLDFEIFACEERELDELCRSLESVRLRLKTAAQADAAAQTERGLLMANLSHDLRTPITAIKGYAEGLRDGIANTPEKQERYLQTIYAKSILLENLVRNMSDFSEYELGRMQYHFEYVQLVDFLSALSEEYAIDTAQHGLTFQTALPPGDYVVTADRLKLKRVLDNLVSNAIKYSRPNGTIMLSAEVYEGGMVICVADNGKGIHAEALHHVFDSFYRADAARNGAVPGNGLGLAICRSIINSHHGKIWLTSEEGEGTRAYSYLPLRREEDI